MAEGVSIISKSIAMIDEKLDIMVTGLEKGSKVTLRSYLKQEKAEFEAYGHFITDSNGKVRLNEEPSVGGTFYGLEPMGLFWSMQLLPGHKLGIGYYHKDITAPQTVTLTVHKGHLDTETIQKDDPIASTTITRYFMSDEIERIPVRHGRIRGILYKPKGPGPFPGVLHMYGITDVPWDYMACRLTVHGLAVLHLLYIGHDDLPKTMPDVQLEYFFEAVDWLCNEPYIAKGGIQLIGVCFGGLLALLIASKMPEKVTAVATTNGLTFMHEPSLQFEGKLLSHLKSDESQLITHPDGSISMKNVFDLKTASEETRIKVENVRKILFIEGESDLAFQGLTSSKLSIQRLEAHGHSDYELVQYPGTGHLIYMPYQPVVTINRYRSMLKRRGAVINWGGKLHAHAWAQEHAWNKLKEFLLNNV